MKKIVCLALVFATLITFCSCGKKEPKSNKPIIAVTILPQAEFVRRVCGDAVEIITMIPSGASSENYEPKPSQFKDFSKAEIYFTIGVPAEKNTILSHVNENTEIIHLEKSASDNFPELSIGSERDPHIWLSVRRVTVMINEINRCVSSLFPERADEFNENTKAYIKELEETQNRIKSMFENKKDKTFFTFHPAFGYFADEYGLTMYAIENEGKEATAKELTKLVDIAKSHEIKTVFCQAETSDKQAKAFASDIGGSSVLLEPLSENYKDNMIIMAELISKAMN